MMSMSTSSIPRTRSSTARAWLEMWPLSGQAGVVMLSTSETRGRSSWMSYTRPRSTMLMPTSGSMTYFRHSATSRQPTPDSAGASFSVLGDADAPVDGPLLQVFEIAVAIALFSLQGVVHAMRIVIDDELHRASWSARFVRAHDGLKSVLGLDLTDVEPGDVFCHVVSLIWRRRSSRLVALAAAVPHPQPPVTSSHRSQPASWSCVVCISAMGTA